MKYYTYSKIKDRTGNRIRKVFENIGKSKRNRLTIFLSHSHKDKDIIVQVAEFLLEENDDIYLYVDWNDSSMPIVTSSKTAKEIKSRIEEFDKFIVLLTENSKESKWVPWELGYADGKKNIEDIAIFPVLMDPNETFKGIEYMELYPQVKPGYVENVETPGIFPPPYLGKNGLVLGDLWLGNKNLKFS